MKNIFFWLMGFVVLFLCVAATLMHPENVIINHHIVFIKYGPNIFMINVAILMFCLPYLYEKDVISSDYHNENDFVKAKANFAVLTILLPGIIAIFTIIFIVSGVKTPLKWVMFLAFLYTYIKSIYLLFFKK